MEWNTARRAYEINIARRAFGEGVRQRCAAPFLRRKARHKGRIAGQVK